MSESYVSFDVDGIAAYVFGAVSPTEVMGASRLVEEFSRAAESLAAGHGGTTIFVGGGSGLLKVPTEAAPALAHALKEDLATRTNGGATCTVVAISDPGNFAEVWAELTGRMAQAKRERGLRRGMTTLLNEGVRPDQVCGSCGREPGYAGERQGRPVGSQCVARLEAAKDVRQLAGQPVRVTRNLEEMMRKSGGDEHHRELLATIYLDADGLGMRLHGMRDPTELQEFALALRHGVQRAVAATVDRCHLSGRVVLPVVGGDDVMVICDGRETLKVLPALWHELDAALAGVGGSEPLQFSAGVAIGPMRAPLRIHFELARRALKNAKKRAKKASGADAVTPEPHVEIRSFAPLVGHGGDKPLFGDPFPRRSLQDVIALVGEVGRLPGAQVAGLRRDLDETVGVVRRLHLDYRATRHSDVARVIDAAEALAGVTGLSLEQVLKGALDLEPVVGA